MVKPKSWEKSKFFGKYMDIIILVMVGVWLNRKLNILMAELWLNRKLNILMAELWLNRKLNILIAELWLNRKLNIVMDGVWLNEKVEMDGYLDGCARTPILYLLTCFGPKSIHHQGALYSAWIKITRMILSYPT